MEVSLFYPNIEITNDANKIKKDLEKSKIKFNDIDGYIIFNAKINKELPEFLVNINYKNNDVYFVSLEYNYDSLEKENYLMHKEKLNKYVFDTFGTPSNCIVEENREINSWVDKKEYIVYNFNGPDYKKNTFKQSDIYLKFIFKREEENKISSKQVKMISIIGGLFVAVAGNAYYLISKNFDFWKSIMCIGVGVACIIALYIFGRFFTHGEIYSPREEKAFKKFCEKFESENELFERFDCFHLHINLFFEKVTYSKIYFAKDKVVILYMPYIKLHKIEIPYSDPIRLKSNKNTIIYRTNKNKKYYFLVANELVANELTRIYRNYRRN